MYQLKVHVNHQGILPGSVQLCTTAQWWDLLMIQIPPRHSTTTHLECCSGGWGVGEGLALLHVVVGKLGISSHCHEHLCYLFDHRVFILLTWLTVGVRH